MNNEDWAPSEEQLPLVARAAIEQVIREHPFWSYERVADEVRADGHRVSVIGVAFVYSRMV